MQVLSGAEVEVLTQLLSRLGLAFKFLQPHARSAPLALSLLFSETSANNWE